MFHYFVPTIVSPADELFEETEDPCESTNSTLSNCMESQFRYAFATQMRRHTEGDNRITRGTIAADTEIAGTPEGARTLSSE